MFYRQMIWTKITPSKPLKIDSTIYIYFWIVFPILFSSFKDIIRMRFQDFSIPSVIEERQQEFFLWLSLRGRSTSLVRRQFL